MSKGIGKMSVFEVFGKIVQLAATTVLVVFALALVVASGLAAFGILPWLSLSAAYGTTALPWTGMALQIGLTVLSVGLLLFVPSAIRVQRLETSHRRFEINMDDITRAYRAAHMADRAEMFGMRREFDAVRERYTYLKESTDLGEIDTELLVIGAQMSEQSRDLAAQFSDDRFDRVRAGLMHRLKDAGDLEQRIDRIQTEATKIARLRDTAEINEDNAAKRIEALKAELTMLANRSSPTDGVVKLHG